MASSAKKDKYHEKYEASEGTNDEDQVGDRGQQQVPVPVHRGRWER